MKLLNFACYSYNPYVFKNYEVKIVGEKDILKVESYYDIPLDKFNWICRVVEATTRMARGIEKV